MRTSKYIKFIFTAAFLAIHAEQACGAFGNYSSILIGDKAAGMGGAFTAMTGDPSACSFYNPATLSRMSGTTLSASANVYNKYDTQIGDLTDYAKAPLRVNRGFFRSLPTASGSVFNYRGLTVGISIVMPDYDFYSGEVRSTTDVKSYLNQVDESLWAGGSIAYNLNEHDSIGLTLYYTARNLTRSVSDRTFVGTTSATLLSEEKNLSHNSLVPILGYQRVLRPGVFTQSLDGSPVAGGTVTVGLSLRLPSIQIAEQASYNRTLVETSPYKLTQIDDQKISARTKVPVKLAGGIAYTIPKKFSVAFDISHFGSASYLDTDAIEAADRIEHRSVTNFAIGSEIFLRKYLAWRTGFYSNYSSHDEPNIDDGLRRGDHVDMYGFSSNVAFYNQDNVSFTFGGFYTGGRGLTTQSVGQRITVVPKVQQIFTMLIATAYVF